MLRKAKTAQDSCCPPIWNSRKTLLIDQGLDLSLGHGNPIRKFWEDGGITFVIGGMAGIGACVETGS
jgi:hypothetical protein